MILWIDMFHWLEKMLSHFLLKYCFQLLFSFSLSNSNLHKLYLFTVFFMSHILLSLQHPFVPLCFILHIFFWSIFSSLFFFCEIHPLHSYFFVPEYLFVFLNWLYINFCFFNYIFNFAFCLLECRSLVILNVYFW